MTHNDSQDDMYLIQMSLGIGLRLAIEVYKSTTFISKISHLVWFRDGDRNIPFVLNYVITFAEETNYSPNTVLFQK